MAISGLDKFDSDILVCACGNTEKDEGFFPSSPSGQEVSPTSISWNGVDIVCGRCGVIFNQFSFEIVGKILSH